MILETEVTEDGMLIIKTPKSLWGKTVKVQVQELRRKTRSRKSATTSKSLLMTENQEHQASLTQWEEIKAILQEIDQLDFPRRTIAEILHDLHEFRESHAFMPQGVPGRQLLHFAGMIEADDLDAMQHAIESECERIDADEW